MSLVHRFLEAEVYLIIVAVLATISLHNPYRAFALTFGVMVLIAAIITRKLTNLYQPLEETSFQFTADSFAGGLQIFLLSVVVATLVLLTGIYFQTIHWPMNFKLVSPKVLIYPFSCVVQELTILYLFRRFQIKIGSDQAKARASFFFGLCHMPNMFLAPLTMLMASIFLGNYTKYRNPVPLIVSHLILGVTVSSSFPKLLTSGMQVGIGVVDFWANVLR
jgi:hypothetical protein